MNSNFFKVEEHCAICSKAPNGDASTFIKYLNKPASVLEAVEMFGKLVERYAPHVGAILSKNGRHVASCYAASPHVLFTSFHCTFYLCPGDFNRECLHCLAKQPKTQKTDTDHNSMMGLLLSY